MYIVTMSNKTGDGAWLPTLEGSDAPRYQAIVTALKEDISSGQLGPGDRIPTQRALAKRLGMALGTVTRAYAEAERHGLIRSRGARGTFIAGPDGQRDEGTLGIPDPASSVIEMSIDLPLHGEDPDLGPVLHDIARRNNTAELLRYHAVAGTPRHREAGVAWAARFGVETSANRVVVCAGTQHALTVSLMSVAAPGDTVLCSELTYPGMKSVASHLHLRLQGVASDERGILPQAVEEACRSTTVKGLYCNPSFHNPTTVQLDLKRRQQLAKLAQKYDFSILEDDVHRLLSDNPPTPIASLAPDHTFFIASLSKALTAGLRVAFLVPPAEQYEAVSQAVWATVWMVSSLPIEVAATWIEDGTADNVVRRKRDEAGERQRVCRNALGNASYSAQPHGYYVWLQLPEPWSSTGYALEARQRGVAITSSEPFSVGSIASPAAVRICLAAAETRKSMLVGLDILAKLLDSSPGGSAPFY